MHHIIKKQVIEVKLSPDSGAARPGSFEMFELQRKVSHYYYSHILPALEKIFDRLSDENTTIQIDRFEIDLGIIQWDNISRDLFVRHLFTLLESQFTQRLAQLGQQNVFHPDGKQPVSSKMPVTLSACEQWIHYMRKGIIPWNVNEVDETWRSYVLEALATDYRVVPLLKELINDDTSLKRIVREHSISFLISLAEILTARNQQLLPELVIEIERMLFPDHPLLIAPKKSRVKNESVIIWKYILKKAADNSDSTSPIQIATSLVKKAIPYNRLDPVKFYLLQKELPLLGSVISELLRNKYPNENVLPENFEIDEPEEKTLSSSSYQIDNHDENDQQDYFENNSKLPFEPVLNKSGSIDEKKELPFDSAGNGIIPDEGVFIKHAGLVLLHPFLKHLFIHTRLIEGGKFIGRQEQEKAVFLLHYLATGAVEAEEYLLAVPKLLCGWPLDQPLQPESGLTTEEMNEADDLIKAAIMQWTILKNTSADGLREGFLQRNGKVFTKNEQINFIIEHNAIDALLCYLPWNLSIIKLPWLTELVRVDWV
jgi:hypothetical protein